MMTIMANIQSNYHGYKTLIQSYAENFQRKLLELFLNLQQIWDEFYTKINQNLLQFFTQEYVSCMCMNLFFSILLMPVNMKKFLHNVNYEKITAIRIDRSSHQKCFLKKGILRNFTKVTGKHQYQSLFFNKVAGVEIS